MHTRSYDDADKNRYSTFMIFRISHLASRVYGIRIRDDRTTTHRDTRYPNVVLSVTNGRRLSSKTIYRTIRSRRFSTSSSSSSQLACTVYSYLYRRVRRVMISKCFLVKTKTNPSARIPSNASRRKNNRTDARPRNGRSTSIRPSPRRTRFHDVYSSVTRPGGRDPLGSAELIF